MDINEILRALLQIAILAFAIYWVLYYLHSTRAILVLLGLVVVWVFFSWLSNRYMLTVISRLLDLTGYSLLVVLFILFQPELRRALAQLGSYISHQDRRRREVISEIVSAACNMAYRKCGALIVIERRIRLQALADDAVLLEGKVNSLLLESIFFPNAPLHDGAVIIRGDCIIAARVILPLTRSKEVSPQLGTRHRAALGISEESDAVVVIVSEETGSINIAQGGVLHRDLDGKGLYSLLEKLLVDKDEDEFSETAKLLAEPPQESVDASAENGEERS